MSFVRPSGVEPETFGSGGQHSIQLSYRRISGHPGRRETPARPGAIGHSADKVRIFKPNRKHSVQRRDRQGPPQWGIALGDSSRLRSVPLSTLPCETAGKPDESEHQEKENDRICRGCSDIECSEACQYFDRDRAIVIRVEED